MGYTMGPPGNDTATKKSKSGLSPGFCPNRVAQGSPIFNERMVVIYSALKNTFENWPPGQPVKNLPFGSMLVYKPVAAANASLVFTADPATGQILVTQFNLENYTITLLMQAIFAQAWRASNVLGRRHAASFAA